MIKMIKRECRRKAFLLVIVFLLVGSYLAVALIPFSNAHKNVPNNIGEEIAFGDRTGFYYEFEKYYGAHDWIADSALRILLADESWRENFTWILREDPYNNPSNPNDNIPFKDFDIQGTIYDGCSVRAWALNKDNYLVDISSEQGVTIYGYDKAKTTKEMGGRKWLHALRYTTLLHGSMAVDYLTQPTSYALQHRGRGVWNVGMSQFYIPSGGKSRPGVGGGGVDVFPSESKNTRLLTREIGMKKTKSIYWGGFHKVLFLENNGYKFFPDPSYDWAASGSEAAGKDAQYFLEWETKKSGFGGGGVEHQPKYLAACISLAIISHYLADLSVPAHVLSRDVDEGCVTFEHGEDEFTDWHAAWEKHFNPFMGFTVDTFPNGGPSWKTIDPRRTQDGYSNGLSRKEIIPLPPYVAASEMAHITFTGYDPENNFAKGQEYPSNSQELKDNYEYAAVNIMNPSVDNKAENWGKNLIKWSVYYTACAWVWVMEQVKKGGHYIGDGEMQIQKALEPSYSVSKGSQYPLENDLWTSAYESYYERPYVPEGPHYEKAAQGMMMAAGLLVPTIALVLISVLYPPVKGWGKRKS